MQEKCKNNENKSIECTVRGCANHSECGEYCALNKIKVTTHEQNPTMPQCTDCSSFVPAKKDCK